MPSEQQAEKVREALNRYRRVAALELQGPGGPPVARGPVPRKAPQKPRRIQVLSDPELILFILQILQILIQTRRRHSGGQAPALRKKRALVPVRDWRDLHTNVVRARNKAAPTLRKRF